MIAPALTENIMRRQAEWIIGDASALLTVAAWADLPTGAVVLPLVPRPNVIGLSIGSGHGLAVAYGHRPGTVAVLVDVAGMMRQAIQAVPHEVEAALIAVRPTIEQVCIHELAHALTAPLDDWASPEAAPRGVSASMSRPFGTGPDFHGPTWAAAAVILAGRSWQLRPARERGWREDALRCDIARYGLDADRIAAALGPVPDEAQVRGLLARGGDTARRVADACRDRQGAAEHRRSHVAAAEVTGSRRRRSSS